MSGDLRPQLEQLRDQLESARADDDETREELGRLSTEVRRVLEPFPADRGTVYRAFRKRLQDAVERFEASHPDLTSTMAQVVDQLGMWGI